MAFDAHKNFAYSTVALAPQPSVSGPSLGVRAGDGDEFPVPPFNAVIWPRGVLPLATNAEIVRVTAIDTDTLTIQREQEGTSARQVMTGDQIAAAITAKTLTDIEAAVVSGIADVPGLQDALDTLQATASAATDAELASAVATINTSLAAKQDASGAATDAELASAVATLNTAVSAKLTASLLGQPNGVASLDSGGKVPSSQLPAGSGGPAAIIAAGDLGAAYPLALTDAEQWLIGTLDANATVTVSNLEAGRRAKLILTQDGTGGRTLTVSDGTATQDVGIAAAPAATSEVTVYTDGTDLYLEVASATLAAGGGIVDARAHGLKCDGTTDDGPALAALLAGTTLRPDGTHLAGRLWLPAATRIGSTVTIDGGYVNTTPADANWASDTPARFEFVGELIPDAGIGVAVDAHGFFGADWRISLVGGGRNGTATDAAITSGTNVVNSPAAVTAGIKVGNVCRVWGANDIAGTAAQILHGQVTAVDAGTGNITLDATAHTTVAAAKIVFADAGVKIRDQVAPRLDLYAKHFLGCCLVMDATSTSNDRVRSVRPGGLHFNACGIGMHVKNVEAFGSLGDIWSDNVYSDYVRADDFSFTKYEGGIGGAGGVNVAETYLLIDRPNNWNGGKIAVGDRATEAGVKIIGISDGSSGADLGHVDEIRSTGYQAASMPAAVKICDLTSGHLGYVLTQHTTRGVHIQGGASSGDEIYIAHHESRTDDDNALYLEPGVNTAPQVTIGEASYRRCNKQAVYVATGLTGGRLKVPGVIVNHNLGNDSTSYAIDVQSAALILDVAGLWQQFRSGSTPGGINHADPGKIRGMRRARIENPTLHGKAWTAWQGGSSNVPPGTADGFLTNHAAFVSGTEQRNDSPFTLRLRATLRYQPTSGTPTATTDVFIARQPSEIGNPSDMFPSTKFLTGAPNDDNMELDLVVPPWHYIRFTLTAATINRLSWTIE